MAGHPRGSIRFDGRHEEGWLPAVLRVSPPYTHTIYPVTLREHGAFEACGGTRRSARVSWSPRKKRARSDALHHALRLPSFLQSDCINRITRSFRDQDFGSSPV